MGCCVESFFLWWVLSDLYLVLGVVEVFVFCVIDVDFGGVCVLLERIFYVFCIFDFFCYFGLCLL